VELLIATGCQTAIFLAKNYAFWTQLLIKLRTNNDFCKVRILFEFFYEGCFAGLVFV